MKWIDETVCQQYVHAFKDTWCRNCKNFGNCDVLGGCASSIPGEWLDEKALSYTCSKFKRLKK